MKNPAQPYLHFDDDCREAMTFYQQVFGGELHLMTIGESPVKHEFSKALHNQVLHGRLEHDGFVILASDMCGMGELKKGNGIQLSLNCSSENEIEDLYKKLAVGGKVLDELKEQFWGALFAMVMDCFGTRWMLSLER